MMVRKSFSENASLMLGVEGGIGIFSMDRVVGEGFRQGDTCLMGNGLEEVVWRGMNSNGS